MTRLERVALGLLALLIVGAVLVPLVARQDPLAIDDVLGARLVPPVSTDEAGRFHLLGTDRFGRDLFVRMMLAGRLSLAIGIGGSLMAGAIGVIVGGLAGWWRGAFDRLAMAATDALLAIPRLILLLLCAALWRPGAATVVIVLAATGWMGVARLVRAEVMGLQTRAFVDAAGALGIPPVRVLGRHVLPNALGPVIVASTIEVSSAIIAESTLSFLGLGFPPDIPTWGRLLFDAKDNLDTAPHWALFPGAAIFLTVLSINFIGDGLRDALDPRRVI